MKVNEQKNKIIAILSHDLAAPLNSLQGLLTVGRIGKISEDEWSNYTLKIESQLEKTRLMLFDLVRWSKTQSLGFVPTLELVDISFLINEEMEVLAHPASEKSISLINKIESTQIKTDKEMFKLIVRNLLSNAIKFSQPNNSVIITSHSFNDKRISVSVEDKGTGIDVATRKELFGQKVESTDGTQMEKGSGLGLFLTKEMVELLRGTIHVTSEVGIGTTFTVTFPTS